MSSSAVILPWASSRIFCRTASDFLEACFVKKSDIWYRASIHRRSVFTGHCFRADYGQLNCQSLVFRRWSCTFCELHHTGSCSRWQECWGEPSRIARSSLAQIHCKSFVPTVRIRSRCFWQFDIRLASAATLLRTTLLIFLPLPTLYRDRYTTICKIVLHCKNKMALLWRPSFKVYMSCIMDTHNAKMCNWNTSAFFGSNHLHSTDHLVKTQ